MTDISDISLTLTQPERNKMDIAHFFPGSPENGFWDKPALCGVVWPEVHKRADLDIWSKCPKCAELIEIRAILADSDKAPTSVKVDIVLGTRNLDISDIPPETVNYLMTGTF